MWSVFGMFNSKPKSFILIQYLKIVTRIFEESPHDDPVDSWQFWNLYKSHPTLEVCATFALKEYENKSNPAQMNMLF